MPPRNKQLVETNTKKGDKEAEIEKLTSQIESSTAKTAKLREEVATGVLHGLQRKHKMVRSMLCRRPRMF